MKNDKEHMKIIMKESMIDNLKENFLFESKEFLKEVLSMISIKKKFQYKLQKSDKKIFLA